ncbi:hypothetical protein IU444_00185 [Nocardia farcinica]|nr:hypothetical protein [Nocardia farcinica]MBC9816253.1 hypothetical protein [Nocardia farcinica]MBF6143093.1 hypothetical protein [Nocardia farcinica]MBF6382537.1 hypothetical protein [Nocardia farcinica]MBF6538457.1 hypothetical protein [Nocardia farcinica]
MGYCAEIVTFTVDDAEVETYLERRRAAITEVRAAHPQLRAVPMCARRADGTWVDVWIYETEEAAAAANADAANLPRFQAMAELLDNVRIEVTDMPPAAVSPL